MMTMRSSFRSFGFGLLTLSAAFTLACDAESPLPEGEPPIAEDSGAMEPEEPEDPEQSEEDALCGAGDLLDGVVVPTGIPEVDTLLETVASIQSMADGIAGDAQGAIEGIASQVEAPLAGIETLPGMAEALAMALEEQAGGAIEEGLGIVHGTAQCVVETSSVPGLLEACGSAIDGAPDLTCTGDCLLGAAGDATCAEGVLMCEGEAPGLDCAGDCVGACVDAIVDLQCEGTCSGLCTGSCDGSLPGIFDCDGTCDGTCTGSCEQVDVIGTECGGSCLGDCIWEAVDGLCDVGTESICAPVGGTDLACAGSCAGEVSIAAGFSGCVATVEAAVNALAECVPPMMDVDPSFVEGVAASTQEELLAEANGMTDELGTLLASAAQAQQILDTALAMGGGLPVALPDIQAQIDALLADADPSGQAALDCASAQLAEVPAVLEGIGQSLSASVQAAATVDAAVSASNE